MMRKKTTYIYTLLLLICTGCIENDLPYPTIKGEILNIAVQGMVSSKIDVTTNTATVKVSDTLDLRDLRIEKLEVTQGVKVIPDSDACLDFLHFPDTGFISADSLPVGVNTRMNFKKPVSFLLRLYQDYPWTVKVEHDINRIIRVKNMAGTPLIDENTKNILIYVDSLQQPSFRNISIEALQLGSSIALTEPEPTAVSDFTRPRIFRVTAFGETEEWTVSVRYASSDMKASTLSAWAKRAYITGATKTGSVALQYRKTGETEWESMLSNELTIDDGVFTAVMTHLRPESTYEYMLTVDGVAEDVKEFTTETMLQAPNLNFDNWFKDGKNWYANIDITAENFFWDSGNKGANTLTAVNPTSPEERDVKRNKAARLASAEVMGVFAAGNIYSGSFVQVDPSLTGASLNFGRPYTGRPSRLNGFYKYTSGAITHTKKDFIQKGDADSCHIYVALFTWAKPFPVNTNTGTFVDLTWNNPDMVAFGEMKTNKSTKDYMPFNIDLRYRDYATKPTYILIVASASKYGDYFTGSTSSVLLMDECELVFE